MKSEATEQSWLDTLLATIRRKRNPARELALQGVEKRKRTVRETAQQIRREVGLGADPRLTAEPKGMRRA